MAVSVFDSEYDTYIYTRSMSYVTPAHTRTHPHTDSLPHKLQKFCGKSFDILAFVLQHAQSFRFLTFSCDAF